MHIAPIKKSDITQYLPARPVIVEAGAHIGRDTIKMSTLWPQATIHAFEPVLPLYEQLLERTADYKNVRCYQVALSNRTGTEQFYISSGASTAVSSLLEPHEYTKDRPHVYFRPEQILTTTLDQWTQEHGVKQVDFMWLDIQGAEKKVLEGSPALLKTVGGLVLEASLTQRFKDIPLLDDLKKWVEQRGFIVIQQDEPRHNKVNILCVRRYLL